MTLDTSKTRLDVREERGGTASPAGKGSVSRRRRVLRAFVTAFFLVYTVLTLSPFYVLFVRTFVGTKDSTTLHLWPPPETPVSLDAEIGNLATFYNLDIKTFKKDFDIKGYVTPRTTLGEIADQYGIPVE